MPFVYNPFTDNLDNTGSSGGGGTVTSVSGTTDRITVTDGTTDAVVDIAATYAGQNSITTLGTIATGVWSATAIGPTKGGTGLSTYNAGDLLFASASNVLSALPVGTNGDVLTLVAGLPSWEAVAPGGVTMVSGTAGRITSSGGNTPVIDIDAAYVGQASITTLGTISTGVWSATAIAPTRGGTGLTTYTTGDILYASAANTLSKLPQGIDGQVLTQASGVPSWATPTVGTVTNVSGTANRITSTGGATPVIDISAAYVGQNSITTLGTVTTGVWDATNIALNKGGTNAALTASNGGIFYSTATAGAILSGTATANQMLLSGASGAPSWSTLTMPSTLAANSLLYGSATNTISELTTTANRIFVTGTGGVPVWGTSVASDFSFTTSGSGVTRAVSIVHGSNTASSNVTFQATVAGASGGDPATKYTISGVADWSIGLDNSDSDAFVISSGTALGTNNVFRSASNGDLTITNIAAGTWNGTAITETKGGTNQTSYTTGDILYASGANTLSKRAIGSTGDVLTVSGGVPTWAAPSGPDGVFRVNRTLTSTEIKSLVATPITLIAAPGAGKAVQIIGKIYARFDYGGTNVFVAGASQGISLVYESSPSTIVGAGFVVSNTTLTGTTSSLAACDNTVPGAAASPTAITTTDNKAIQIKNGTATEITGNAANNNTVTISFCYCIVP